MNFSQVLADLQQLVNVQIQSIRPGASLIIRRIDSLNGRISLVTAAGDVKERSLDELRKVWNALVSSPAIRVEEVLQGSGSSRNQPETILANLPYVEWARINGKKHISFVGQSTHPFGTLKQMGGIQSDLVAQRLNQLSGPRLPVQLVIVASDLASSSNELSNILGSSPSPDSVGVYRWVARGGASVLLSDGRCGLPDGMYPVLQSTSHPTSNFSTVEIGGDHYSRISLNGHTVLVESNPSFC